MIEGLFRAAGHFSTLRILAKAAVAGCPRKISNAALPETFNHRERFLV